jgi:peroxiredoxin
LPSHITQAYRELKEQGLVLLPVSIKEPRDTVAAWGKKVNIGFPLLLDEEGTAARAWRITSTPTVFLIDRRGRVVGRAVGTKPWSSPAGLSLLKALLAS